MIERWKNRNRQSTKAQICSYDGSAGCACPKRLVDLHTAAIETTPVIDLMSIEKTGS